MKKADEAVLPGLVPYLTRKPRVQSGVMTKVISPSINVVHCNLVNPEDDSILVIQRSEKESVNPGKWEKLSGKIDVIGLDAIAETVSKECREELGFIVNPAEVYSSPRENELLEVEHPKYAQIMTHPAYVVYVPRLKIALQENGHSAYRFVNRGNYDELDYISGVRESLDKFFSQRREEGVLFPYELAQVIKCVIVDEAKQRILIKRDMRERAVHSSFPSMEMKAGGTPFLAAQQLLGDIAQGEFMIAPLTGVSVPKQGGYSASLHHYFAVKSLGPSFIESIRKSTLSSSQYQWIDVRSGYGQAFKQIERTRISPASTKALEKLLFPNLESTLFKIEEEGVSKTTLRKRSNSIY